MAAVPAPSPCAGCWDPEPTTEPWQWQLQGKIDLSVPAPVYDVDIDPSSSVVEAIHAQGDRAICYVSVGTYEPFRDDAKKFPKRMLGKRVDGFEEERWLDVRELDALAAIMEPRFDECAAKGFDAVEPDNVDAYQNRSGFPLDGKDQLAYNAWVANAVHERGMAGRAEERPRAGSPAAPHFDFAVNEQCFQYRECGVLERFVADGKPVFGTEYELGTGRFCEESLKAGFSTIFKRYSLKAFRETC